MYLYKTRDGSDNDNNDVFVTFLFFFCQTLKKKKQYRKEGAWNRPRVDITHIVFVQLRAAAHARHDAQRAQSELFTDKWTSAGFRKYTSACVQEWEWECTKKTSSSIQYRGYTRGPHINNITRWLHYARTYMYTYNIVYKYASYSSYYNIMI